jgi:hypothetical protein
MGVFAPLLHTDTALGSFSFLSRLHCGWHYRNDETGDTHSDYGVRHLTENLQALFAVLSDDPSGALWIVAALN